MYSVLYVIYAVYCQLIYSSLAEAVTRGVINMLNEVIFFEASRFFQITGINQACFLLRLTVEQ